MKVDKRDNNDQLMNYFGCDICFRNRDICNTKCIFIYDGSCKLYDTSPTCFNIAKGSMKLGLTFAVTSKEKFVVEYQT